MTRSRDIADQQDNLGGAVPPFTAGKNKVINGDFNIWQRGTSFTNPTDNTYFVDRFKQNGNGSGFTKIWSRQTFTPGTAPVAGYEGKYFMRFNQTVAGTGATNNNFAIYVHEDVRTFAGQTVTLSFWAKADAARTITLYYGQEFRNGGTGDQYPFVAQPTLSTSWARYSFTFTVASTAGKTIGEPDNQFQLVWNTANNLVQTIDLWGVQLEAGSVATPFTTATGTIQGELAACQRYYVRYVCESGAPFAIFSPSGQASSTTLALGWTTVPVELRIYPSGVEYGGSLIVDQGSGGQAVTGITVQDRTSKKIISLNYNVSSGLSAGQFVTVRANNSSTAYLGISAEL